MNILFKAQDLELIFTIVGVLTISITVFVLLFLYFRVTKMSKSAEQYENLRRRQVYIFDNFNGSVTNFNFNNPGKLNKMSEDEFFNLFKKSDREKVKDYILNALEGKYSNFSKDNMLICNTYVFGKSVRAILFAYNVDVKNKTLYLEIIHLIHNKIDVQPKNFFNRLKDTKKDFYDYKSFTKIFESPKVSHGTLRLLQFGARENILFFYNPIIFVYLVCDMIYGLMGNDFIYICYIEEKNQLLMLDLRQMNSVQRKVFSSKFSGVVTGYLESNGLKDDVKFSLVTADLEDLPNTFDNAYAKLNDAVSEAYLSSIPFSFYSKEKNVNSISNIYNEEITSYVNKRRIDFMYKPIIHFSKRKCEIVDYLVDRNINKNVFNYEDFDNVVNYFGYKEKLAKKIVTQVYNDLKDSKIAKNIKTIIFNVNFNNIELYADLVKKSGLLRKHKVSLLLKCNHSNNEELNDKYLEVFKNVKDKNVDISLYIDDPDFDFQRKNYTMFDSFYLGMNIDKIGNDVISIVKIRKLINRLISTGKPIVALSLKSFEAIKAYSEIGIKYFSNDFIINESNDFVQLDKKTERKLKSLLGD